jgi:hypothetical protein
MRAAALAISFLLGLGAACTGAVDGGSKPGTPGKPDDPSKPPGPGGSGNNMTGGPGGTVTPPPPPPQGTTAGVSPLRRLTGIQYQNTVRDLLGLTETVPITSLPADEAIADKFTSNIVRPLQGGDLDKYAEAAEALARKAVGNLSALVPCTTQDATCAGKFIESFGRRAYRRPLVTAEIDRLKKLHATGGDFNNGVRLVVQALLQSPKFLYLIEPVAAGGPGSVVGLDNYSLASRLSYFLWNSMPDDQLLDAAAADRLTGADGMAAEAGRLMKDKRFKDTVATFHDQWLDGHELRGASKDAMLFPTWNEPLRNLMEDEGRRFVEHVLSEGDAKLETLLTANYSFLSGALYDVYGMPKPAGAAATAWTKVDLKKEERAGVLTHAGLLAGLAREDRTSFVRRGKLVMEAFLCKEVPPPPPNVNDAETNIPATASARERAAQHRQDAACAVCHDLFDPLGFAFENYDAMGRFRTSDGGKPVDAKVEITGTASLNGPVTGAVELVRKLAGSPEVKSCVAKQWLRFALGREDGVDEKTSLDGVVKTFNDSGGKLGDLLLAVVRSDAFRHRKVEP